MKKKVNSLNELIENSDKSRQDVLVEENLIAPPLNLDPSVKVKSNREKRELKAYKKYHKRFGKVFNTTNAKTAFYKTVIGRKRWENKLDCSIVVVAKNS